jgi:hypothetical protein
LRAQCLLRCVSVARIGQRLWVGCAVGAGSGGRGDARVRCNARRGDNRAVGALYIRHVTSMANGKSDLAIFSLEPASALPADRTFTHAMLSTRTPSVGERLTIVGSRQWGTAERMPGEEKPIEMQRLHSTGIVTVQYPPQRDCVGLPCPCGKVNCHAPGGHVRRPSVRSARTARGRAALSGIGLAFSRRLARSHHGRTPSAGRSGPRRRCMIEPPDAVSLQKGGLELRYEPWA